MEDIPILRIFPKVHKPVGPLGHSQSRPVEAAASGLSSWAGNVLVDFLEPLVNSATPWMEDRSTGKVSSQLEEVEVRMMEEGITDTTVGSLDVLPLYPSLDHRGGFEAVYRLVLGSRVQFSGIDWRAAQIFLESNLTASELEVEGLKGLVPGRLKR